jgi:hypothetical protein
VSAGAEHNSGPTYTMEVVKRKTEEVYPGSRLLIFIHVGSRILDQTTTPKEEGDIFFVLPFF